MSYDVSRVRARLRVTSLIGGDSDIVPITSAVMRYAVNSIPTAIFHVPYGTSFDNIISGGSPVEVPDNKSSYEVELLITENTSATPNTRIFHGHINAVEHDEERHGKGTRVTRIRAENFLGLLRQQTTSVLTSSMPDVWQGNPWWTNATGLNLSDAGMRAVADGYPVASAVIDTLAQICNCQLLGEWQFQMGDTGAEQALWVLEDKYQASPGSTRLSTAYSAYTREELAMGIRNFLGRLPGDLWTMLLSFCSVFEFGIIPRANSFLLVPIARLAWDTPFYGVNHEKYYREDLESVKVQVVPREVAPNPVRTVVMVSPTNLGPWNLGEERSIMWSEDLVVAGERARYGRAVQIDWPGWFPMDIPEGRLPRQLCRQRLLDETFGNTHLHMEFPKLERIAPGSLIELRGVGGDLPPMGDRNLFGFVQGVEIGFDAEAPEAYTNVVISHVMDEDAYESLALNSHPLCDYWWLGGDSPSARIW